MYDADCRLSTQCDNHARASLEKRLTQHIDQSQSKQAATKGHGKFCCWNFAAHDSDREIVKQKSLRHHPCPDRRGKEREEEKYLENNIDV